MIEKIINMVKNAAKSCSPSIKRCSMALLLAVVISKFSCNIFRKNNI